MLMLMASQNINEIIFTPAHKHTFMHGVCVNDVMLRYAPHTQTYLNTRANSCAYECVCVALAAFVDLSSI